MITSKDIIEKTNISRATLNNYIKLGILPKPVVGPPPEGMSKVKQIGFFPDEALEMVERVRQLKKEGKTITDIARLMSNTSPGSPRKITEPSDFRRSERRQDLPSSSYRRRSDSELKVTICDITSPAYLVNRNFEVEWINKQAESIVFGRDVSSLVDIEARNIFKLFLGGAEGFNDQKSRDLILLHLTVLKKFLDSSKVSGLYKGATTKESEMFIELYNSIDTVKDGDFHHIPFTATSASGIEHTYYVHTMTFREGTFFVFVPKDGVNNELLGLLKQRKKVINELLRRRMPSLVPLAVMIADLQDSVKISAELLPAQYFELINGLWDVVGPVFEKHNGIYGKHVGDGMLYYFIDRPGENHIINSINCAIEIREVMKKFSNKWKGIKGWANDLYLNTGINEGQEFFGTIHSANSVEFTALGDTINVAARLSEFAEYGEIWTTKNVISKLSQEERANFRFGVHYRNLQREPFIRDSFSRVSDLISPDTPLYHRLSAIAGLPITEIKEKLSPSFGQGIAS